MISCWRWQTATGKTSYKMTSLRQSGGFFLLLMLKRDGKLIEAGAPHSRDFSHELGAPKKIFKLPPENCISFLTKAII